MSEITGYINIPFHGESAYDIAVRYGYTGTEEEWIEKMGSVTEEEMAEVIGKFSDRLCGYVWYADSDRVVDKNGNVQGKLSDCMNENFVGSWFYVRTVNSEAGVTSYSDEYKIDGANGFLSLRDYVVWTGVHLVHIPTFEAKASDKKNSDGKYSPKSGVDGLMSSTDKAYLSDLINEYWGKDKLNVFNEPEPKEGWQTNWLFDTGIYLGGIKKDCGGHPPVFNDNHTSWVIMVFNGMATDAESLNRNHRVQIAFDLVNSKIYMRRGWMSSNSWADSWTNVGDVADGSITKEKLSEDIATLLENLSKESHSHDNKEVLDKITEEKFAQMGNSGTLVLDYDEVSNAEETLEKTLTVDVKEVVVQIPNSIHLVLPNDAWQYWSCIINTGPISGSDGITIFDVEKNQLFMSANEFSVGKMYRLVFADGEWNMHEIDPISRAIVE